MGLQRVIHVSSRMSWTYLRCEMKIPDLDCATSMSRKYFNLPRSFVMLKEMLLQFKYTIFIIARDDYIININDQINAQLMSSISIDRMISLTASHTKLLNERAELTKSCPRRLFQTI